MSTLKRSSINDKKAFKDIFNNYFQLLFHLSSYSLEDILPEKTIRFSVAYYSYPSQYLQSGNKLPSFRLKFANK